MKNGRNSGWFVFLLFAMFFGFGGTALLPLIIVVAVVVSIAMAASNAANRNSSTQDSYNRGYRRTSAYRRSTEQPTLAPSDAAKINVYLRRYFKTRKNLDIGTSLSLRVHGSAFASLSSLDVYRDDTYICSFDDFTHRYPDSFREIIDKLIKMSANEQGGEIIDAEVVDTPVQEESEAPSFDTTEKNAQYFIDTINTLNSNIPDEEITNGLYETTSLLKQIQTLELKLPKSKAKLSKLYEYYLPILVRVLKQFENLQDAKTDENYDAVKEKLTKTIRLINDAMKTIISSMTDADMLNLSADLSTLEALLQKDGLTGDQLKAEQSKEEGTLHE